MSSSCTKTIGLTKELEYMQEHERHTMDFKSYVERGYR